MDITEEKVSELISTALAKQREEVLAEIKTTPQRRHFPAALSNIDKKDRKDKLSEKDVDEMSSKEKARIVARSLLTMRRAGNNLYAALELAEYEGQENVVKALGTSTIAGGGGLIAPEFSAAIIEMVEAQSVFRKAGPEVMPMNSGSLTIPYESTAATAAYTTESANITKSEPTLGQLQLSDKKLAALIPASYELLDDGGAAAENWIMRRLTRAMTLKEDITFFRSAGASGEPMGLLYLAAAANKSNSAPSSPTAPTHAEVLADLETLRYALTGGNVTLDNAWYFFSARTETALRHIVDASGVRSFRDEMVDNGTLNGHKFAVANQIPNNLGVGTDASEIYFVNMSNIILAENENLRVDFLPNVAYHDGSAVVSGASRDESVFRAISRHDLGAGLRGAEIAVLEEVHWT